MRKFFISILILSALTSEGVVHLSEGFCDLLYPYMESSLSEYVPVSSNQLQEDDTKSCYCNPGLGEMNAIFNKVKNAETKKTGFIDKDCCIKQSYDMQQYPILINLFYTHSFVLPNKDFILERSDLSPPAQINA